MWWRIEAKFERQADKIEGVRQASENAHKEIRGDLSNIHDDLCDLKVTTAVIKTDVEWLKNDRQN